MLLARGTEYLVASRDDGEHRDRSEDAQSHRCPRRTAPGLDAALRFSLIIVTKDRPATLRSVLQSALRGLPPDAEVIVVDGDPARSAEGVVQELRARHERGQLRYETSTPGITVQRNVGIDSATGEFVVLIDDDCSFEPGMFNALLAAYEDPAVVGATGRIERPNQGRLGSNPNSRLRWLVLGCGRQGSMSSFGFRHPIIDVLRPRDVEFMPGPLMSARRAVAVEVRFDEQLAAYGLGEDDDFSYRLSRRGRIRYQPAAVIRHNEQGWRQMDRRRIDRLQVVHRAYLFHKNFPQTLRARAGFIVLLAILCAHRAVNREWSGLRGLLQGIWQVYGWRAQGSRHRVAPE